MTGLIKTLTPDRGFGFITGGNGTDYFFHRTNFYPKEEFVKLRKGDRVSFEEAMGEKGPYAEDVVRD